MISAEKRKYDRVKKLRARDKLDMIAGNKASQIDSASPVLVNEGDTEGQLPGLVGGGDAPVDDNQGGGVEPEASTIIEDDSGEAVTLEHNYEIITTTLVQTIPGGPNGMMIITRTQVITVTPEGTVTNAARTSTATQGSATTTETSDSTIRPLEASSSGGLSNGVKIGIGVAVPIVFILLGLGIFFFFRRRKQRLANGEGGVGEVMIIGGKHHDEDGSSGGVAGSPTGYHPNAPPPGAVPGADVPVPVVAPVPRSRTQEEDDDLMNRPVSPVHDDDLLTGDAGSSHSVTRSGTALGGSVRDRGSPSLDDDREMQWILEEERKAKERREQQGRLPTHT